MKVTIAVIAAIAFMCYCCLRTAGNYDKENGND